MVVFDADRRVRHRIPRVASRHPVAPSFVTAHLGAGWWASVGRPVRPIAELALGTPAEWMYLAHDAGILLGHADHARLGHVRRASGSGLTAARVSSS